MAGEVAKPIAGRREDDVVDACGAKLGRDLATLFGGTSFKSLSKLLAPSVDADLPPRLWIDEPQVADVRQRLFARIANLDSRDVMPVSEL